ncbi:MAG TPA: transglutaminase-like cysteine peptidase [Xanthobacteraceae bacterium]
MQFYWRAILRLGWIVALAVLVGPRPGLAQAQLLYASVGDVTRPPIGWVEFCAEHASECNVAPSEPRNVVLTPRLWRELVRVDQSVNTIIRPMTDLEHYGVVEKWAYPEDGYGDCEDYVLLKRRILTEAGWPREALLITVVREKSGDGHAVLTVRTDRGDFVLDNQNEAIVLWSESGYHFVKRQSQSDPNVWVSLGDPRPSAATATSR